MQEAAEVHQQRKGTVTKKHTLRILRNMHQTAAYSVAEQAAIIHAHPIVRVRNAAGLLLNPQGVHRTAAQNSIKQAARGHETACCPRRQQHQTSSPRRRCSTKLWDKLKDAGSQGQVTTTWLPRQISQQSACELQSRRDMDTDTYVLHHATHTPISSLFMLVTTTAC